MSASSARPPRPSFPLTPPPPHPLGPGKHVKTAGCIIIGDEVLNGKTNDTNSNFLAKLLFDVGVDLKRIEVIPDEEEEIVEAARRMVDKYDFVCASGGIGPTHDDITYQSIAKAFDPEGKLAHHDETIRRMHALGKRRADQTPEQQEARNRMALLPVEHSEVLFVKEEFWVPVVRMKGRLCILPGIPRLFEGLVTALVAGGYVPLPPASEKPYRHLIHTSLPESSIAPFLSSLAKSLKPHGVSVGSYPQFQGGVTVSLIGKDQKKLQEAEEEVVKELQGEKVSGEAEGGVQKVERGKLGEEKPVQ